MGLDYSQKRLISKALHAKGNTKEVRRMRFFAFLTGIMSLMVSAVYFYLTAIGRV
jgi:hypothetical protein